MYAMPLNSTVHPWRTSSLVIVAVFLLFNLCYHVVYFSNDENRKTVHVPIHAPTTLARCHALHIKPGPPPNFYNRDVSDRFQKGTKPVIIRNATVWTGRVQGLEVLKGDILLDGGIIRQVGPIADDVLSSYDDLVSIDANGYARPLCICLRCIHLSQGMGHTRVRYAVHSLSSEFDITPLNS